MQTKLTLRLENSLIEQAKEYAQQHNKSLSQIVADYFKVVTKPSEQTANTPITNSLIGVLEGANLDLQDYRKHLENKHL